MMAHRSTWSRSAIIRPSQPSRCSDQVSYLCLGVNLVFIPRSHCSSCHLACIAARTHDTAACYTLAATLKCLQWCHKSSSAGAVPVLFLSHVPAA